MILLKINFLNNLLDKPVNSTNYSFIGNFINELKENLIKKQSYELAKKLPWHTILNFAKFDGNFAMCFDNSSKKIYYIPKDNILGTLPEPGEVLKINSPGKFYVDYTGIPITQNKINDFLDKCVVAK